MNFKKVFLFLVISFSLVMCTYPGVQWVSTIKTNSKNKRQVNDIEAHVFAQGGNVKQVWKGVATENMMYNQGGYFLYKANDNQVYVVNDEEQNYMVMDIDQLLQMTGMFGQLVKIEIIDHNANFETFGKETVAGYPCTHLKITTEYTMKMKIAVFKKTFKMKEVKEIWATKDIPGLNELHDSFKKKDFKTGISGLDEMIKKSIQQQQKHGFPLKMITNTTQMNKKGKVKGQTSTVMEITKIKKASFKKEFFDIPAGYQLKEMPGAGKLKLF